jgi:outer membrane protein assembly factor BamE (lipoprotein component of BamABCDE complex)
MRKPKPATAPRRAGRTLAVAAALATAALVLGGCMGETFTRGQKITAQQLEQVPVGSSREQVILALGTPSTTGVASGEVFYYISATASRTVAFQRMSIRDRRVLAVYLDDIGRVTEMSECGLRDGKVFDYLNRRTPTAGKDLAFIGQILSGASTPSL